MEVGSEVTYVTSKGKVKITIASIVGEEEIGGEEMMEVVGKLLALVVGILSP